MDEKNKRNILEVIDSLVPDFNEIFSKKGWRIVEFKENFKFDNEKFIVDPPIINLTITPMLSKKLFN